MGADNCSVPSALTDAALEGELRGRFAVPSFTLGFPLVEGGTI